MIQAMILLGVLLVVGYYWYATRKAELRLQQMLEDAEMELDKPVYRCVRIEAGNHACQQARMYQSKPILVADAPRLPLLGCNAAQCNCKFLRFDDRRSGQDRRITAHDAAIKNRMYADKRIRKDRRKASIHQFLQGSVKQYSHGL